MLNEVSQAQNKVLHNAACICGFIYVESRMMASRGTDRAGRWATVAQRQSVG